MRWNNSKTKLELKTRNVRNKSNHSLQKGTHSKICLMKRKSLKRLLKLILCKKSQFSREKWPKKLKKMINTLLRLRKNIKMNSLRLNLITNLKLMSIKSHSAQFKSHTNQLQTIKWSFNHKLPPWTLKSNNSIYKSNKIKLKFRKKKKKFLNKTSLLQVKLKSKANWMPKSKNMSSKSRPWNKNTWRKLPNWKESSTIRKKNVL